MRSKIVVIAVLGSLAAGGSFSSIGCKDSAKEVSVSQAGAASGGPVKTPHTNPPVVVRGGAITIRTRDSGGWQNSNPPFCTNADISFIELDDVGQIPPATAAGKGSAVARGDVTLSNIVPTAADNWIITIYGRDTTGKVKSGNGIQLTSKSTSCSAGAGTSVSLTGLGGNGGFYQDGSIDDDGAAASLSKRFRDSSCVPSGASPNLDEDFCEHASEIDLVLTIGGTSTTQKYSCVNGECEVAIGKPQ